MQSTEEREAFEVRDPLPYIGDQARKGAILLTVNEKIKLRRKCNIRDVKSKIHY